MSRLLIVLFAVGALTAACKSPGPGVVRGNDLREIIENQIRENVRESYGELAGENFSDADLAAFTRTDVPKQVTTLLEASDSFRAAVDKVRAMPRDARTAYLRRCRLPLRKTWRELGAITPEGTTDAGQQGEVRIANAIVDLAETLLKEK